MTTRSDEDILAGQLRIAVGGHEKLVPTLKPRAAREWIERGVDTVPEFRKALAGDQSPATLKAVATLTANVLLDLVVAYDVAGALGGREWLEENADPAQLYAAFRQMGENAVPFAGDAQALLQTLPGMLLAPAAKSEQPSSTNGRSHTGAPTHSRSKSASTPRS